MSTADQVLDPPWWPVELRYRRADRALHVAYDDGAVFALPAELLRVESPSAEVQGHNPADRKLVPGKRNVGIRAIEPVGNYAVRLVFDDGHDTGIFTWRFLRDAGERQDELMARYTEALAKAGLSRDR
ncbi:MAG: gamma-butyrobetaine hydroxylase-like domain-containing protein [Alphaproteobacteria bacterium]